MNTPATSRAPAEQTVRVSHSKITIAMILCGIVSAAGIGAAGAATSADEVPSTVVKYQPDSLLSDAGAHQVYRKIVKAAEQVCPGSDDRLPSAAVRQCRAESISRAVTTINSSRLAAIHDDVSRSG
jgi:UrcA family protein